VSEVASEIDMTPLVRVAVHADDPLRRTALCKVIAASGHTVVDLKDEADVVLADASLPAQEVRSIIGVGVVDDRLRGALPREADARQIDAAIRAVAAGLVVRTMPPRDDGFGAMRESNGQALLTPRELEVLAALAEGLTNKAIARRLDISLHTVKFHVESLFRKLGARTRTEAVAKAAERRRNDIIML
jgi:DNA-binding CsgD family transcriptional regulator